MTRKSCAYKIIVTVLLLYMANLVDRANAESITSADITAKTIAAVPSCMHYKLEGACFWVDNWGIVSETPYVDQYLPDVVVSIFNKPGENPWLEMNDTIDQAGKAAEEKIVPLASGGDDVGYGQHSMTDVHEQSAYFKEAEVIGNPALAVIDTNPFMLTSAATTLMPYFQSMLDATMWRGFSPEAMPEKIVAEGQDMVRRVGTFPITWGGVFPIEGSTNAGNDAKAAAVIAQRAVNMLSLVVPLHIYNPLSNSCGQACSADSFHENDDHTQFQRIYPDPETTCEVFGKTLNYGDGLYKDTNGAYTWIVWRHYHGCVQGDGKYIGHT
jgi:integrating conjugative element protein (TIGR03756 family)